MVAALTLREWAMLIEHILAEKGHTVIAVEPGRTLLETARLLTEKRIGAVVVSDADHPVLGIISERDIVRAVGDRGAAALDEPVSQHKPRSCSLAPGRVPSAI